jgi:hypothetical protein
LNSWCRDSNSANVNTTKESHGYARARDQKRKPQAMKEWPEKYLEALASTGQKVSAAKAAGVTMRSVCRRRCKDLEFARAEKEALMIAMDLLESEAVRRAVQGTTEIHYGKDGRIVSRRVIYSDALLLRILERADSSWRTKSTVAVTSERKTVFATRADRKAALTQAKANVQRPPS